MKDLKTNTCPIGLIWAARVALLLLALSCPHHAQGDRQLLKAEGPSTFEIKVMAYDPTSQEFTTQPNKPAEFMLKFQPKEGQSNFPALLLKVGGKAKCVLERNFFGFVCDGERFEIVSVGLKPEK